MDWIIRALAVLREIRDWADDRTMPQRSREALSKAADWMETAMEESKASERFAEVPAIGPAAEPPTVAPANGHTPVESGPRSDASRRIDADVEAAQKSIDAAIARRERRMKLNEQKQYPATDSPVQEIPLEHIDPHALEVIRRLRRFGYRAYLVGGCVRDLLLGLTPKDYDVATSARPEEVKSLFRNSRVIGRRFRLVHVYFRGGKIIEVSTFRANAAATEDEAEDSQDLLIRRDNVFGTEEEDALRRDFTINALFYDIGVGRIIDHVGGLEDIESRYLRMIGDPEIRLREDPVRILRAIRIAAKVNLTIDQELLRAMIRHKQDISRCPPARVLEETLRLLRIGHSETTVRMMEETGVLAFLVPEIPTYLESPRPGIPLTGAVEGDDPAIAERGSAFSSRELMYRHLRTLDQMIAQRNGVSDAVVLGAFLYAIVSDIQAEADIEGTDRNRATAELLQMVGARLALTRRLSEHLRQIFIAQRHFTQGLNPKRGKRKMSPASLARRVFFPDALELYEIHARAVDLPLDEIERWRHMGSGQHRAAAHPANDDEPPIRADRPKRRRRRGGRGRSRPQAPT
jgi:poly(A) polymerase